MVDKLVLLGGLWIGYFIIHSLFASLRIKHWVAVSYPAVMPYYRFIFNGVATLLLLPPLWLVMYRPGLPVWEWSGMGALFMNALAFAAIIGFLYSLKFYDGAEFLGFRQIRDKETRVEDQENLYISPLHRYVRHPWYFFALILIWTRDMTPEWLLSAILLSVYFIYGSKLEDRKLIAYYGEAYRAYKKRVPGVFPLPFRYLDAATAREFEDLGNERSN